MDVWEKVESLIGIILKMPLIMLEVVISPIDKMSASPANKVPSDEINKMAELTNFSLLE
jgi:hypothetical protein